jgi:hypothetical protein
MTIILGDKISVANVSRPLNDFGYDNSVLMVDFEPNIDYVSNKTFGWDI